VGYYVPGYVLGSLIVFVPKAMGTALPQLMSRAMDNGNESEARIMLRYAIKIFLLLSIPFIFGCLAVSKPLLALIANQEVSEKAFLVTPVVALGTLFYGLTLLFSNVLFVRLKTNAIFQMNLIAALFSLLANMLLLYFFRNVIVAAITTFLSYLIAFLYSYRIVVREWKVDFNIIEIAKMVMASLVMYLQIVITVSHMDRAGHLAICVLSILTGTLTYILVLMALKILTHGELQFIRKTLVMNKQTHSTGGSK
jgi:O-antigen/teichoic acid export membrane protein